MRALIQYSGPDRRVGVVRVWPLTLTLSPQAGEGIVVCKCPTDPMKDDHKTLTRARALRARQTDAEQRLWLRLRNRQLFGLKFRRQYPVGPFIADFCCPEAGVIVELDGGQHALDETADAARTAYLNALGYKVLRFWNNQIFEELEGVLARIATAVGVLDC